MNSGDLVSGFRKAIQDLLVPELKVLQTEVKHLSEKIDRVQDEMDKRFEQMDKRFEAMQKEFVKMQIIQEKILDKLDVDKRITRLETLVEQLLKKAA